MLGRKLIGWSVPWVSVGLLAARAPKAPVPGYPASLLIRDSGPWTLRLAQASRVKGGLEVEAPGTRAVLEHPLDAAQIVPNQVHTLQFRPRTPGGASGFDLELAAGPDSLYQGAKLVFHVEGMRRLRGLKTSNEHWVAAGTNGTPQVTWGLQLARAKDDLLRLLEFN